MKEIVSETAQIGRYRPFARLPDYLITGSPVPGGTTPTSDEVTFNNGGTPAIIDAVFTSDWVAI